MASDTHVRTHFPPRLPQLILAHRLCRKCRDGRGGHDGDDGHDSHVSTAPWNGHHRIMTVLSRSGVWSSGAQSSYASVRCSMVETRKSCSAPLRASTTFLIQFPRGS